MTDHKLLRVGVRSRGCSGLVYNLEYTDNPGKFDEVVEQDGVKLLVDGKAIFSVLGSTMHYKVDELSSQFTFENPNIKETCGCGQSFLV